MPFNADVDCDTPIRPDLPRPGIPGGSVITAPFAYRGGAAIALIATRAPGHAPDRCVRLASPASNAGDRLFGGDDRVAST